MSQAIPSMPRSGTVGLQQPGTPVGGVPGFIQSKKFPMFHKRSATANLSPAMGAVLKPVAIPRQPSGFIGRQHTPAFNVAGTNIPMGVGYPTGMHSPQARFVPKVYEACVYPPQMTSATTPHSQAAYNYPRCGTEPRKVAFRPRRKTKAPVLERKPSIIDGIKSAAKMIDTKEAGQLVGGFISGMFNVLTTIVNEIREDVITGLFKPEDPSYDAAHAYYYAGARQPRRQTGLTQRIDYTEAIERQIAYKNMHARTPSGATKRPQVVKNEATRNTHNEMYNAQLLNLMRDVDVDAYMMHDSSRPPSLPGSMMSSRFNL
ncbi:hypothetical protein BdWA1_001932 [Babesia duncani]|uniref:Uncharacterized protein n=1 Tax=Babesia duncani TaxID=323732 RepID=A0AAD9PKW0_9APIC|nr:hypothetical protein BdWA1_001932 [Babesia duncani]